MKFGIQVYPWHRWPDLRAIAEVAAVAEEYGFDAVALPDHVVAPAGGDQPPLGPMWPDAYLVAAHLSAATTTLRLMIYASVIPYRPVIQQAKAIATLDQLSGGRLVVVAGSGWCEDEFDRLGVAFGDRAAITDEYLSAMIALWTEDMPRYDGIHAKFESVLFAPRCHQVPHVPIWIAGSGKRPERRLVSYGTGWAPMSGELPQLAAKISAAKRALVAAGRSLHGIEFSFGFAYGDRDPATDKALSHVGGGRDTEAQRSADRIIEQIAAHEDAGFTQLVLSTSWSKPDDLCRRLEWFAENIIREAPVKQPHGSSGHTRVLEDVGTADTLSAGHPRKQR